MISHLIKEKLRDRHTYGVALVVGTVINLYGQLLVPWLRGTADPFSLIGHEFQERPALTLFSIFLGYAFPLCVGVYSSVATRYRNRRVESIADFPERKPDPVFRANRSGEVIEAGATTIEYFRKYSIFRAQKLLGEKLWTDIVNGSQTENELKVFFEGEGCYFLVKHAQTPKGDYNIYLTRLAGDEHRVSKIHVSDVPRPGQ